MRSDENLDQYFLPKTDLAARQSINVRARRTSKFDMAERYWVGGDPFATAFFNALSAVFPHGETFMIRSLMPLKGRVPEPLNTEIAAFIEQEAGHSREHVAMNKGLVAAGFDVTPLDRAIRKFVAMFRNANDVTKVGATMCIEHITAIIAAEVLKNDRHLAGSDSQLRELWLWHAVEEVEHKAVAFDTFMYLTRDWSALRRWATRSSMMLLISASFLFNRTRGQIELLRQDGYSVGPAMHGILKSSFGKDGIGRNVIMPLFHFLKPGFHPWDIDDHALISRGDEQLKDATAKKAIPVEVTERRKTLRLAKAA